ncbi:hypothetical protein HPB49_020990 [Dermacentor silvarum]|uniref:Uncharacterized protein n=1 Tax=Dermacentor silvarum TaxID=543639 RepID=A0ACB8CML0_DERSI|nr:hypothetical protein HPB49_020990 [Dermacentor silvarum]
MSGELVVGWLKTVWQNRPGGLLRRITLLVVDSFRGHLTDRVKVCDARASHGSFSLAAYDVNYDEGNNSCSKWGAKGHYSRLNLVRQLNAFMRGENTGDSTLCDSDSDNTR